MRVLQVLGLNPLRFERSVIGDWTVCPQRGASHECGVAARSATVVNRLGDGLSVPTSVRCVTGGSYSVSITQLSSLLVT